ncbi:glycosyltransferase [Rhodoblastus acidophilus]|uniref:Glycosyltransferase n=1 Tax=Candidatus Rhodoblastus alkanivorans TaxID=2954117 RepID=A0ABS9Z961_9HYPH|nr:galactosyltransferase-related protein [Candidatus Rhodoblastus alkanivorans]MCI4678888.1 glycosyltransferase [Candidatus Rhodoblastus alkanivorans]MCI4684188.1 glycosyltransferase [Candidatus Rhodoblastus alkanivorans]
MTFPKFSEEAYLEANPDVAEGIVAGRHRNAYDHYLNHGVDENRTPKLSREPMTLVGSVEHFAVSESGYFTIFGWLGDEGVAPPQWRLVGAEFDVEITPDAIFRHARKDVESGYRDGAYDYGFIIFGRTPSKNLLKQPVMLQARSRAAQFKGTATPDAWSDRRVLDTLLIRLKNAQSHRGLEAGVHQFLAGSAGETMTSLFTAHAQANSQSPHVETFRPRPVSRSFLTVLFGSVEPMLLQPLLFNRAGVDFGEWIYVCNSPEDGNSALRIGRTISELYDVMITVVVMADNVGFGAANNVGVSLARGNSIYIVNPDIYPMKSQIAPLRRALDRDGLGDVLWGGLLFYDEQNLMHSGMFIEQDVFIRGRGLGSIGDAQPVSVKLARVEHFDKGVPFVAGQWKRPLIVPAISGAVMAFDRRMFDRIGGFSTRYIYGHYEDADLSLRWAQENGPVAVDPDLRLVHLEGQGSKAKGEQYRGAQLANRHLFSARYADLFQSHPELMTGAREFPEHEPETPAQSTEA